jgi:hypothetical protein
MYIKRYKILALPSWCRRPAGNPFPELLFGLQRLSVYSPIYGHTQLNIPFWVSGLVFGMS